MILFGETRAFYPIGPRVAGLHRVATIGDSITYGAAVGPSDTLASHLELTLNAAFPGLFFETVNLGRNGSNFWHAWSTFEFHFAPQGFDAAVVSVCSNDTHLFDGNGVHYAASPWEGSFQFLLFTDHLKRIKTFAERHAILVIVNYYSFAAIDMPRIVLVQEACATAGLPFIDMRGYLIDELGGRAAQYVASPLDGHPSNHAHGLAAKRIADEIVRLGWFPAKPTGVDVAETTSQIAAAMRGQGRPIEEALKWCWRVLEAKMRSWQRRLVKPVGIVLGDAAAAAEQIHRQYQLWCGNLGLLAWTDTLSAADRDNLWRGLASFSAWLRDVDELLYCLEYGGDDDRMREMSDILQSTERVGKWRTALPARQLPHLLDFQSANAQLLKSLAGEEEERAWRDELPPLVGALIDLIGQTSYQARRLIVLSEEDQSSAHRESLLQIADGMLMQCRYWANHFGRAMSQPTPATLDDRAFYTDIDVLVEAPTGSDENGPRTFLYVAVDYRWPPRRRIVERQLCGFEKRRWVYTFRMPIFALGDLTVWVPKDATAHDRFASGRVGIATIRVHSPVVTDPSSDDVAPVWSAGSEPLASIYLGNVRPRSRE